MNNDKPTTPKTRSRAAAEATPANDEKKGKEAHATLQRRDATGHINPVYAAGLRDAEHRAQSMSSADPSAFLHGMHSSDPLAEELGEHFVRTALSGEDSEDDDAIPEEIGGPFVETRGRTELAAGTDPSNPKGASREPFPTS